MDCFSPPYPSTNFYSNASQANFELNSLTFDQSHNLDAPNRSNDVESLFTPEQVSALLEACDSTLRPDSTGHEPSTDYLTNSDWNAWNYPEQSISATEDHHVFTPQALQPMMVGCTTYRNGFGDPILPVDYRPYDPLNPSETYSVSSVDSSVCSPSDSHSEYPYVIPGPAHSFQNSSSWNSLDSPDYSHFSAPKLCTVTGPRTVPEQPVKKHRCQICGRAFQRQTTLTQHQITHTGERPYACPVAGCDKAFTTASNAKRHAKTHFRLSQGFHHVTSPVAF